MPISKQDKQELNQWHSDWYAKYGGVKEDYFALMYLCRKKQCTPQSIAGRIAFGGNDFGIDAYDIDPASGNLYIYQFKWSENHNLFKDSFERLANDGMKLVFGDSQADPGKNEFLNRLRSELYEYRSAIKHVCIHFVFMGDQSAAEDNPGLDHRKETLQSRVHLIQDYFADNNVDLAIEYITDVRRPPKAIPHESFRIRTHGNLLSKSNDDGNEMHVAFVPLIDLYRVYANLGKRFLDRNIRFGLAPGNTPSVKITDALTAIVIKQSTSPTTFAFNHNGITLAVEKLSVEDGRITVKVPRLLNGAQTITTFNRFMENQTTFASIPGSEDALESICVLAKIVVADPTGPFVTNVTICNNCQNPVESWDLRANDLVQCDLEAKLREEAGVFYSRQENAFRNYTNDELEELGVDASRPIMIRQLAQTFLAAQGEILRMSELPKVFESQKWYEEAFRNGYPESDARKIVLCYKIHLFLRSVTNRLMEISPQKHGIAISKSRNLIWALLIQAVLNDTAKLPDLLDSFGSTMKRELQYDEYLKKAATSKIQPILRDVFNDPMYKERLLNEKYDFLRTKELFNQCKSVASEKFGWAKKSL